MCHCSPWFRQDHGFDPPCGSHQLSVYLNYSVHLKLLAQLIHMHSAALNGIEKALFLLAITASQWCNVLFDPDVFEARPCYSVFL